MHCTFLGYFERHSFKETLWHHGKQAGFRGDPNSPEGTDDLNLWLLEFDLKHVRYFKTARSSCENRLYDNQQTIPAGLIKI